MAAIVENHNGVEVIAKFVALQVNRNNSAIRMKMTHCCLRFVHACLLVACSRFGPFQPSRSEQDRISLKLVDYAK